MTDQLNITVDDASLIGFLSEVTERLEDPSRLMSRIGERIIANTNQRFVTKQDPAGLPWEPLAESTLKAKKGQGSILALSGLMLQTLDKNVSGPSVEVGFAQFYAGFHETGSKDGRLPRRGMLLGAINFDDGTGELGANDTRDVLSEIQAYLANGI